MRRIAIAITVASVAVPSASVTALAGAATWPVSLTAIGFCSPAPTDGGYVRRAISAQGVAASPTKPIAILDTGVDPNVPQLAGRVLQGYDALTGAPVTGDPDGHGTEAAALAAASDPSVPGISPASTILPVRIYDADRTTSADAMSKGIALAVAKGAGVVVIEGSGQMADIGAADELKVTRAIDDAFRQGVLVVAGVGDDTLPVETLPGSLPHVLAAGAATSTPSRSAQVDTGPWLDLLVPAEGIEAALPASLCAAGYGFSTGSSYAAPTLGGVAALVMAQRPGLSTQQYFELIRRAGTDLGAAGRDDDSGFGLLNVATALSAAPLAKESTDEVDDDPFWVRGAYAKAHPPLLTKAKMRFKIKASVSPAKDPADVYPVSLIKRERMVVSVTGADPNALLELSILNPKAGDFDITGGVDKNRSVSTGGLSSDPQLEITASRSGTYYIAVEAADPIDPDDATAVAADLEPYQLSAYKQRKKAKKKKARKSAFVASAPRRR